MNSEVRANLQRAHASLKAAKLLLDDDYPDFAASRAYYAAFYASVALLLHYGMTFRKHSGVIAAIHREFVRTGKLDKEQGKVLSWLFELRGVGDYGMMLHVTTEEAEMAIALAENYVIAVQQLLDHVGGTEAKLF